MSKNNNGLLGAIAVAGASIIATNKYISEAAKKRHKLDRNIGDTYFYTYGDVHYTKHGEGKPILLIHDANNISSSYEWKRVRLALSNNYTVYSIDLIGSGLSDKPNLTYTTFMYVELVHNFINDIVKEKVDIITSHDSASIAICFKNMYSDLCGKLIMINPNDLDKQDMESNQIDMLKKKILFMPVIGTFFYNIEMQEDLIKKDLRENYFSNGVNVSKYIDAFYEAAHADDSKGRFLYACKKCKYLNTNIANSLKDKKDIYILESEDRLKSKKIAETYQKINKDIKVTYLPGSKLLPQIETPELVVSNIKRILK